MKIDYGSSDIQESVFSNVQEEIILVDEEIDQTSSSAEWRIDTDALTGLRGLVALHIALGHMFMYSKLGIDLQGGMSMSFFYLLSGFIMTIAYGSKAMKEQKKQAIDTPNVNTADPVEIIIPTIDKWNFWRNRFARLYPMYFITNLTAASFLFFEGFDDQSIANIVLTITGMNLWVYPFDDEFFPLNGVTWTIQTMWFFYLVFPALFPVLLRIDDCFQKIRIMYWVQLVCFIIPYFIYISIYGEEGIDNAYWVARAWPLSRLPVFVMGCLAGIERVKHKENDWCHRIKPTALSEFCCCFSTTFTSLLMRKEGGGENTIKEKCWERHRISNMSAFLYLILLVVTILGSVLIDENIGNFARPLGEAITPLLFLRLILSLTETTDECQQNIIKAKNNNNDTTTKRSVVESICRSKVAVFLGNISLCFYLIHAQVIHLTFLLYGHIKEDEADLSISMPEIIQKCTGKSTWKDCFEDEDNYCGFFDDGKCSQYESDFISMWEKAEEMPPIWIIPVNLVISLILGYALTYMVEKPMQRLLRH